MNQFPQLLENDGKGTEAYEGYLYFRSFSVVFAQLTELIHLCFNSAKELRLFIQIPFRVFRDFPYVPLFLFWIYSANFSYRTLDTNAYRMTLVPLPIILSNHSTLVCMTLSNIFGSVGP